MYLREEINRFRKEHIFPALMDVQIWKLKGEPDFYVVEMSRKATRLTISL